jgi:hypothetical protein
MGRRVDYTRKKYAPLLDKTLKNAVAHRIGKEFPRIGGPRMRDLCAELVLDVVAAHLRPREDVTHGQMLWMAVSVNDPPRRGQRIADTDLVPVVLDLSIDQDVQARLERVRPQQRWLNKALRLCRQAYEQGGLLSNCDLAELLNLDDSRIAHVLAAHERQTEQLVPRRATVHDVGTGLTHKRIICRKHYVEGKPPDQVARETYHSLEAVDRYLGQYDRVRHCRLEGLSPEETAQMLNCGVSLVREYLRIDRELEGEDA